MEKEKDTFTYTYSAKQQEEIRNIRKKYLPREEDKMEQLRRLDRDTTRKGTVLSVLVGVIGCLLLGVGMCCTMVWMKFFIPGVVIGLIGIGRCGGCLSAVYPRDEKRTGKVGAANFEADRRAVGSKIKKRTGRKGNLPYGPVFYPYPVFAAGLSQSFRFRNGRAPGRGRPAPCRHTVSAHSMSTDRKFTVPPKTFLRTF